MHCKCTKMTSLGEREIGSDGRWRQRLEASPFSSFVPAFLTFFTRTYNCLVDPYSDVGWLNEHRFEDRISIVATTVTSTLRFKGLVMNVADHKAGGQPQAVLSLG